MIEPGQLRAWNAALDITSVGHTFTVLRRMGEFHLRDPTSSAVLWEVLHHERGVSTGWSTEFLLTYSDLLQPVQQEEERGITGS